MEDRIGRYLRQNINELIFAKVPSVLGDVPLPLDEEDVRSVKDGKGISNLKLTVNMARIIGSDPAFRYADEYVSYIRKNWGDKISEGIFKLGKGYADEGNFVSACVYFRACLILDEKDKDARFNYALVLRELYLNSHEDEFTGRFKAEAIENFEKLTLLYPDFADAYYYLGYSYLNLGLYSKAYATWRQFLKMTEEDSAYGEKSLEIKSRLSELEKPVEIEKGYNDILAGRFAAGIAVLEAYRDGEFSKWWPLHYYLGVGYECTGETDNAIESFRKVLTLNAGHVESLTELANLYMLKGDNVNSEKYAKKAEIVKGGK